MDTSDSEKLAIEISLVELYRVRALVEQGLAKPEEKSGALQSAYGLSDKFSEELLRRKAQKLIRTTIWTKSTHDGFVAQDEASQLDPWIAVLEEALETRHLQPTALRFVKGEPASNVLSLVELLKGNAIIGVFDPFLDTRGIRRLLSLQRMGTDLDPGLRCLTSGKAEPIDELTVQDVFKELKIQGQIRQTGSKEDHRRFLLLKNNKVLILGNSLNDFNKDEAAHIETSEHDHEFFERIWNSAQSAKKPVPPKGNHTRTRPIIDFAGGGFIHTGGPSGRRAIAALCNQGDAPAMSVEMRFEADDTQGQQIGTEFPIPTLRPGESTPGNVVIDYAGCPLGTTPLSNPRIIFKATDMYGNAFESMRSLVQEGRADGGYNLKAGGVFRAL